MLSGIRIAGRAADSRKTGWSYRILWTRRAQQAFSLVEMLVAIAVFCIMLALVFSVVNHTSGVWRRSSDKIQAFQEARLAFEALTRNLSQATLNSYLDYDSVESPTRYLRKIRTEVSLWSERGIRSARDARHRASHLFPSTLGLYR
jgi:uncharacterized protein (TIGR02599 family)